MPIASNPSPPGLSRPPSRSLLNRWFIDRPVRGVPTNARIGNETTAYIEVADYYNNAAEAIESTVAGGYVLLAAWAFGTATPVTVGGKPDQIGTVLTRAGARGVSVRVLLSGHLMHPNGAAADWFNSKKGCTAILDDRLRSTGSFHQKALVVSAPNGPIAFVGGMDFGAERLRSPTHGPWHDIQVRLVGGAANDILDVLADRWDTMDKARPLRTNVKRPIGQNVATSPLRAVQVARTYGNPTKGFLLTDLRPDIVRPAVLQLLRPQANPYRFAPDGDSSIHDLLIHAISATAESLYIEDQYFILADQLNGKNELLDALAATIAKETFKKLIVITCDVGTINGELYQVNRSRLALWNRIAGKHPEKISVWSYKDIDRVYWMHSKTWIFDDVFAVIGSANFNRRSLSNDGELGIGILDVEENSSNWVKELRMSLWVKHLSAPERSVSRDQVRDFMSASPLWIDDPTSKQSVLKKLDLVAGSPWNPDHLYFCGGPAPHTPGFGIAAAVQYVMCKLQARVKGFPFNTAERQWELIDPDGN